MTKFESIFEDLKKALLCLEEVLKEEKTDITRDSAIQRFEIVFELAWKTIKAFLEEQHNIACVSPINWLKEAFRTGIIDYDDQWLQISKLRNYTVHTYNEKLAEKVYAGLPTMVNLCKKVIITIEDEINKWKTTEFI